MKVNEFEEMLNSAIGYLDKCSIARVIRDLGYNLHFYNEVLGHDNTDDQPVEWLGIVGLEDTSIYLTAFDGAVNPNITKTDLIKIYNPFLKQMHKCAINKRFGLNRYMPTAVTNAVMDTARLACLPYNYIMVDTDAIYTLWNKENPSRRVGRYPWGPGKNYLMAVEPKKIHFNGPATIVEWNDGTKTVVKCQRGDTFDPLTGVAMCCMKKMLGTNESGSNYLNDVSKLIDEALEAKNKRYEKKEKGVKRKKEIGDPDWNVVAQEIADILNNSMQEDKHD